MASTYIAGGSVGSSSFVVFAYFPSASIVAGDLLFVLLVLDSAHDVVTPAGWTADTNVVFGARRFRTYRRTATSGETYTQFETVGAVATTGAGSWIGYRSDGGEEASGFQGSASTLSLVAPSVSPVAPHGGTNKLVCLFTGSFGGSGSLSVPGGMTSRSSDLGTFPHQNADEDVVGNAASGTRTSTASGGAVAGPAAGWSILLRGEPAGRWTVGVVGW